MYQFNNLTGFEESFIGYNFRQNKQYGFIPHFKYFLDNKHRWLRADEIQSHILTKVPEDINEAWEVWRRFRSAQAEITSIFIIENYLKGNVRELEVARPGLRKRCDIMARFISNNDFYLEVKAQSGQQKKGENPKHPLYDVIDFEPRFRDDLSSWLFDEKQSKDTGELMVPYCLQAAQKGADVLISMTDIFFENTDMLCLGKFLVPDHGEIIIKDFHITNCKKSDYMRVFIIEAGEETSKKMSGLKETWIFNNSKIDELIVIIVEYRDPIILNG